MPGIDGVGDAVHVGMASAVRLVQRGPAGHHHVRDLHQAGFAPLQGGVVGGGCRVVMAVVDHAARIQGVDQRQRPRRVEPYQGPDDAAFAHELRQQPVHHGELVVVEARGVAAGVRHEHLDALGHLGALEPGVLVRRARFLDVEDAVMLCKPGQQLLRALPVETPTQRREHDQGRPQRRSVLRGRNEVARQGMRSGKVHGAAPGARQR